MAKSKPTKRSAKKRTMEKSTMEFDEILPSLMRSNMLRMILTKHIELNKMADMKANMLMTAASIIIAVLIANFDAVSTSNGMIILLCSSILAIFFAILVIIPKPQNKKSARVDLLYFRSFRDMSEDEYVEAMLTTMERKIDIYKEYIRDIYQYGSVTLTQKYRLLTTGLVLFLFGIIVGGLEFMYQFITL